jgi:DNA-directed RNA polymerase subunit RPC12/RpoP
MKDIKFICPHCGQSLAVDAASAGASVACPQCSQTILVPQLKRGRAKGRLLAVLCIVVILLFSGGIVLWQRQGHSGTSLPPNLAGNLVFYYNFDSKSATDKVPDLSRHGNDGQAVNVQWIADGHRGGALSLSPDDSHIRVPNNASLNPPQFTLDAWIKTSHTDRYWRRIFDKGLFHDDFALSVAGDWNHWHPPSKFRGFIEFELPKGRGINSRHSLADGQWHQIAATYDGEDKQLFVDGQLQDKTHCPDISLGNDRDLVIGGFTDPDPKNDDPHASFDGSLDDVMMFNRALSPNEVTALYNSQKTASAAAPEPEAPPVAPNTNAMVTVDFDTNDVTRVTGVSAGRMFPKTQSAPKVYVVNCINDNDEARRTAFALQGLINQSSAEVYIISRGEARAQLAFIKEPIEMSAPVQGENTGLRTLFQKYQGRVKRMFLYDAHKDWTWYLAQMAAAQQDGIPVTESMANDLMSEFGWKGGVEDFRDKWPNQIEAYDWALTNLMPACSRQVVFEAQKNSPLCDYVVASRGFNFWLDPAQSPAQHAETEKIFSTKGYGVGTSLMGYHYDRANKIANPHGIGCVVSDNYANGSFWAGYPDKTYTQPSGTPIKAEPGKIYASFSWSDGDNLSSDQRALFEIWNGPDHGTVPVASYMSPALQELNTPLLDWYYSRLTTNDELMCGPSGAQFIFVNDYDDSLFPAWCKLTREWCQDAGFHDVRIWIAQYGSQKYTRFMKTCGFDGVLDVAGAAFDPGYPPKVRTIEVPSEEDLFTQLTKVESNPQAPVFVNFTCILWTRKADVPFSSRNGGFSAIKRQVDRVEAAYPGRYVFLLPKDQFATIRAYYHLPGN